MGDRGMPDDQVVSFFRAKSSVVFHLAQSRQALLRYRRTQRHTDKIKEIEIGSGTGPSFFQNFLGD